ANTPERYSEGPGPVPSVSRCWSGQGRTPLKPAVTGAGRAVPRLLPLRGPAAEEDLHPTPPLVQNLVERRDDQQRQERRCDHAADHRSAQRRPEIRALAEAQR